MFVHASKRRRGEGSRTGLWYRVGSIVLGLLSLSVQAVFGAPQAELWPRWQAHDPASTVRVDHSNWGRFLDEYLVTGHPSGVNRVDYAAVTSADKALLDGYVAELEGVKVSGLNRDEQLAYWVNLYNAATVELIVDKYPVDSIRDIKPGLFASGP